ncbi:hypothetical protein Gasu2_08100 [Galdieria sulphuraria]|nr:hypothetical protein Gasu2_08100 [Galdieria sulphuraria]
MVLKVSSQGIVEDSKIGISFQISIGVSSGGSDSFSTEDLVQHKEKELQTLIKVRDHTREIWEQLKLRIQTFEKYETILAVSIWMKIWQELYHNGKKFLVIVQTSSRVKNT